MGDGAAIRDASTVVLWRRGPAGPEVLMGQRGSRAVFLPDKFVFPGGAIDSDDAGVPIDGMPGEACLNRLAVETPPDHIPALLAGAIRELWEEAGLILGTPGDWSAPPADWRSFAATGHRPSAAAFTYVFRAITPPDRPRRFDARFFLAPASAIRGDAGDFSRACDELRHLQWIPLAEARNLDLPFITTVVLAELGPLLASGAPPASVPFVKNDDVISGITRLV